MIKNIKPLPISEETLGAYLEGNLSSTETTQVEDMMNLDYDFRDFVVEVSVADPDITESIFDAHPNFDTEFELPEVPLTLDLHSNLDWSNPISEIEDIEVATSAYSESDEMLGSGDNHIPEEIGDDSNCDGIEVHNDLNGDTECMPDNTEL